MKKKKLTPAEKILNTLMKPVEKSYKIAKRLAKKTKEKAPYVYDQIDSLLQSHVVTLSDDEKETFQDFITSNIIKRLPVADDEIVAKLVPNKPSKSLLDMLLGTGKKIDYTKLSKKKLFKRILIANRGEIALRIIRACKELGIGTAVIYSEHEKSSLAVKFSDKAYAIGSSKNYLNTKKILKITKKAKADAIHPGYGYLSENAEFADLCNKNKVKFIGPPAKAMSLMGNKVKAREIMTKLKIPVIEGTTKALKDHQNALEVADKISYPVILKAAAGGGGKGMRIVLNKKELVKAFNSAENEAQTAFGDKSLYMEKYIEEPRHIEFQILADSQGNVIHLGERECSIQRRHQKLIEEAPSTALTDELRQKMGQAAKKIAAEVGYEGAGTVEFLVDKKKNFYFMEVNARIQVEHGVTEMVTGVDLVKEQIKIASGATLAHNQEDIKFNGWAIECRINAEDPYNGFTPSTGAIVNYLPPAGQGIRISSCTYTGHIISHHYDPLISNLICWGHTRNEAITRMGRALSEYIIDGIKTNIPFHQLIMDNKNFIKGKFNTHFIQNNDIVKILRRKKARKKELSKKEKMLLVTTAVAKYLENKPPNKQTNWATAAKKDLIQ
jgi:acetyl-CoA carboxylase biotin carboxylase subunit